MAVYPLNGDGNRVRDFRKISGIIMSGVPSSGTMYYGMTRAGDTLSIFLNIESWSGAIIGGDLNRITRERYKDSGEFFFNPANYNLKYAFVDDAREAFKAHANGTYIDFATIPGPTSMSLTSDTDFSVPETYHGAANFTGSQSGYIPFNVDPFQCDANGGKKYLAVYMTKGGRPFPSSNIPKYDNILVSRTSYATHRIRFSGYDGNGLFITPWSSKFHWTPGGLIAIGHPPSNDLILEAYYQDRATVPDYARDGFSSSGDSPFDWDVDLFGMFLECAAPEQMYPTTLNQFFYGTL
jgi:hypothetical protein